MKLVTQVRLCLCRLSVQSRALFRCRRLVVTVSRFCRDLILAVSCPRRLSFCCDGKDTGGLEVCLFFFAYVLSPSLLLP